jgi:hypothetical protein
MILPHRFLQLPEFFLCWTHLYPIHFRQHALRNVIVTNIPHLWSSEMNLHRFQCHLHFSQLTKLHGLTISRTHSSKRTSNNPSLRHTAFIFHHLSLHGLITKYHKTHCTTSQRGSK